MGLVLVVVWYGRLTSLVHVTMSDRPTVRDRYHFVFRLHDHDLVSRMPLWQYFNKKLLGECRPPPWPLAVFDVSLVHYPVNWCDKLHFLHYYILEAHW